MPSWSLSVLLPSKFKRSTNNKHKPLYISSPTSSSTSSSDSSPIITPTSSTFYLTPLATVNEKETKKGLRRKNRVSKPVRPRSSSLFFPTTELTPAEEDKCIYRASCAGSLSDLLLGTEEKRVRKARPVSEFWGGGGGYDHDDDIDLRHNNQGGANLSSPALDLSPTFIPLRTNDHYPTSSPYGSNVANRCSWSVGDLTFDVNRYSNIAGNRASYLPISTRCATPDRRVHRKSVDYTVMLSTQRSYSTSGGMGLSGMERGTEIWSSPYDSDLDLPSTPKMPPPPVPARSNLRPSASAHNLRDRFSRTGISSNSTPTEPALSPSTSSRSHTSSEGTMPITPPSTESGFGLGRKKRPSNGVRQGSISGDPMRIKDGATARESTSGVYTPSTFPGVAGSQNARPTASSSKVYTPSTFQSPTLTPLAGTFTIPAPSPSRSTSVSSTSTASSIAEVTTPRTPHTPLTPSSRFLGAWGSAVSGIKRASASLSTRSMTSPSTPVTNSYTPTSAREGYFPSTIYESEAQTATSAGTPLAPSQWQATPEGTRYGMGLGLRSGPRAEEAESRRSLSDSSERFGGALVGDVPKGKRKPVPKGSAGNEIREEYEEELVVQIGHAL